MGLVTSKNVENTYTSKDGSIFIDFDAVDEEIKNKEESENK